MSISEPFRVPTAFEAARQAAAGTLHWRKVEVSIPHSFPSLLLSRQAAWPHANLPLAETGRIEQRTLTSPYCIPSSSGSQPQRFPYWRRRSESNRRVTGLQPIALPLCYVVIGTPDRNRTCVKATFEAWCLSSRLRGHGALVRDRTAVLCLRSTRSTD